MNRSLLRVISANAAMVAIAVMAMSTPAHATLEIALQEAGVNGGAITVVQSGSDFGGVSYTGTYGDFKVSIFGGTSDNAETLSDLLSSTTSVQNVAHSTSPKTLTLWVTQTNYTLPNGTPLIVESGLGGSISTGTVGLSNIFQAYADSGNNPFGTTGFTNGPQTAIQTGSTFDTGSKTGSFARSLTPPPGYFSLTTKTVLTLSGSSTGSGAKMNYSNHVNVTGPEPSTMLLAGLGASGLIGYGLRRRKANLA